jgi:hypothetical protein
MASCKRLLPEGSKAATMEDELEFLIQETEDLQNLFYKKDEFWEDSHKCNSIQVRIFLFMNQQLIIIKGKCMLEQQL